MTPLVTFADLSLVATGITFTLGIVVGVWIARRR